MEAYRLWLHEYTVIFHTCPFSSPNHHMSCCSFTLMTSPRSNVRWFSFLPLHVCCACACRPAGAMVPVPCVGTGALGATGRNGDSVDCVSLLSSKFAELQSLKYKYNSRKYRKTDEIYLKAEKSAESQPRRIRTASMTSPRHLRSYSLRRSQQQVRWTRTEQARLLQVRLT